MNICMIQSHSENNADVWRLSHMNHANYANMHGYSMLDLNEPYNPHLPVNLIVDLLHRFDAVALIGTDIIIQHPERKLEDFIRGPITMCREAFTGTLNGDFILMTSANRGSMLRWIMDTQHDYPHFQGWANAHAEQISESPILQIADPWINRRYDYSGIDVAKYFSVHFHTLGYYAIWSDKIAGMKRWLEEKRG